MAQLPHNVLQFSTEQMYNITYSGEEMRIAAIALPEKLKNFYANLLLVYSDRFGVNINTLL